MKLIISSWLLLALPWQLSAHSLVDHSLARFQQQSQVNRPYIIELYTSQGCHSCPPAQAWLSQFLDETALWQKYFPLAFHVTYWDYLGWRDVFGQRAFSQRQYDHLHQKHTQQVYTPQFVINGQEWRGWFNRDFTKVFSHPEKAVGVLDVSFNRRDIDARDVDLIDPNVNDSALDQVGISGVGLNDNDLSDIALSDIYATFTPDAAFAAVIQGHKVQLHFALVGAGISSHIMSGENQGKQLRHDFTVLKLQSFDMSPTPNMQQLSLNAPLTGITKLASSAPRLAWVVWLTVQNEPVQAVGAWLQ